MIFENGQINLVGVVSSLDITPGPNHLNHARLTTYFDLGRAALQKAYGIGDEDLAKKDLALMVTHSTYSYKNQIFPGQKVKITSKFAPYQGGLLLIMGHEMSLEDSIIATGVTEHTFVRLSNGKVVRQPLKDFIKSMRKNAAAQI